jgi:hypothetical protein
MDAAVNYDRGKADKLIAEVFDRTGNLVSGLSLEPIGEDGHQVANLMWKISGYLKNRATAREDFGDDGTDDDAPEQQV